MILSKVFRENLQKHMKVCVDQSVMPELFKSTGEYRGMRSHINYRLLAIERHQQKYSLTRFEAVLKEKVNP